MLMIKRLSSNCTHQIKHDLCSLFTKILYILDQIFNDRTSNSIMLVVWMDHQILNIANDSPVTDESSHSYNLCINVCTDNIQTVI